MEPLPQSKSNTADLEAERPLDVIESPVTGEHVTFLKRAGDTEGEYCRLVIELNPGASGPPEHIHPHQEEYFHVRAGTLTGTVDGEPMTMKAGDEFTVWPGTPHEWGNGGGDKLEVLIEVRPAGQFAKILEVTSGLARDGKTNDEGIPKLLQMAVIGQEYWDYTRVPSPPPIIQRVVFSLSAPVGRLFGYKAYYPKYSPIKDQSK